MEVWCRNALTGEEFCVDVDVELTWGGLMEEVGLATGYDPRDVSLHHTGDAQTTQCTEHNTSSDTTHLDYDDDEPIANCNLYDAAHLDLHICNRRVLNSVLHGGAKLKKLPPWAAFDEEVVAACIAKHGKDREVLRLASRELRDNAAIVGAALRLNGRALEFAGEELRGDFDLVLLAVRQHGCALQYADVHLRASEFLVLTAVETHGAAFKYATEPLRQDRAFVLKAVTINGMALQFASAELRRDREVAQTAVRDNTNAKKYADIDRNLLWGAFSPGTQRAMTL